MGVNKNIPDIVRILKKEKDRCELFLRDCNKITSCSCLNSRGGRFRKAEICDNFFCTLFSQYEYVDKDGHDIVNKSNGDRISLKSGKKMCLPTKKVIKVIVANKQSDENTIGNLDFDGMLISQNGDHLAMAYATRKTVEKSLNKIKGGQITATIKYEDLFWIIHPDENIFQKLSPNKIENNNKKLKKENSNSLDAICKKILLGGKSVKENLKELKRNNVNVGPITSGK